MLRTISSCKQFQHAQDAVAAGRRHAEGVERPMQTALAPSAMALTMSEPRQKPPSMMISARPLAAATISGSTSSEPSAVVELAAAVVGDVDHVDAVLDRELGVLGGGDALDDQRQLVARLDLVDLRPIERLLMARGSGSRAEAA